MHEAGPNWRNRCYATDIDVVIASLVEIDNRQHIDHIQTRRRRHTNFNAMATNMQTLPENPSTPLSIERQTPIGTPLSLVTSPTYAGEYSPEFQSSSIRSPESSFSAPTSSSSGTNITRCSICGAVFTGSKRDRDSNLRRHKRTTAGHGNTVGLHCTVPGCSAILSRSDNLGTHMRTVHRQIRGQR